MKPSLIILFLFMIHFKTLAQNQRFIYEYSFKPDSLNKENVIKELMNLDVTKEGSTFYSSLLLDRDSVVKAQYEQGKKSGTIVIDLKKVKRTHAHFIVSKTYPDFKTTLHTSFNALNLAVLENKEMKWKIFDETKILEGFKVQKATTNFAGRNWTAWFTTEIQIQDGPYKFHGLPGLILNIADSDGDHWFNIVGIKKQYSRTFINHSKSKEIIVTEQKFNQLWNEYKKDPAKNIKLMHGSSEMSATIFYDSNNRTPLTKEDLIRNKEEGDKKFFKYYNNYIEKSLYK